MTFFSILFLLLFSILSVLVSRQLVFWIQKNRLSRAMYQKLPQHSTEQALEGSLHQVSNQIERWVSRYYWGKKMTQWIADAGSSIGLTVGNIFLITLGLQVTALNIAGLLGMSILGMMLLALCVEMGIIVWILMKGTSTEAMEREFPIVLEIIAKVYRLHPDLKESSIKVSHRVEDLRLKRVFSQAVQLSAGGLTMIESLEHTARNLAYPPLNFMIAVVKSRLQLGGSIPLFLEEMATSLKIRRETERQIATTVFQNKISALIVSVLVPLVLVFSFLFSEQYRTILLGDPYARLVITAAMVWWAIGVVFIFRVVRVHS